MKHFTSKTQKVGELGESAACDFLKKNGFVVIERNVANRYGEIDIVAKNGGTWYFFEVKTGKQGGLINPAENLTKQKMQKVYVSVQYYVATKRISQYRIQGIVVLLSGRGSIVEIFDIE